MESPAYKMYVEDLQKMERVGSKAWAYRLTQEVLLDVELVHVQGTLLEVLPDNVVVVDDGTGSVRLTHCQETIDGCDWAREGMYVSASGRLVSISPPEIHAEMLNDRSDNPYIKEMWPLEIKEARLYLANEIEPDV